MANGEELGWEKLSRLDPADVCSGAQVSFDKSSGVFSLGTFGQDITVDPDKKEVSGNSKVSGYLLKEFGNSFRLSVLYYLTSARDIPLSGKLVKPAEIPGGQIFIKGTHVLPLHQVAEQYGSNLAGFLGKGKELGAERLDYADASLKVYPFPRVPISILLWQKDEEFPARCQLLLDASCRHQLPVDIIWSTAMITTRMLL